MVNIHIENCTINVHVHDSAENAAPKEPEVLMTILRNDGTAEHFYVPESFGDFIISFGERPSRHQNPSNKTKKGAKQWKSS